MDRFERTSMVTVNADEVDLHSNMDRFERSCRKISTQIAIVIYIPIWIDLKVIRNTLSAVNIPIYIPIWIDLKDTDGNFCFQQNKIYIPIWIDLKERAW